MKSPIAVSAHYSTLLRHLQVDLKGQQELMRHADIRTKMDIYTDTVSDDLREANEWCCSESRG